MIIKTAQRVVSLLLVITMLTMCNGCAWLDALVQRTMDSAGMNPNLEYTVSVMDMKVVLSPNEPITIDSRLVPKLMASARQGIDDVQKSDKGKAIRRVDNIPKTLAPAFYGKVLADGTSAKERRQYLSNVCDQYSSNILIWSIYIGDDVQVKYIAFLYRRDIDTISVSNPDSITSKQSDVEKQEAARRTVRDLLAMSIDQPKWTDKGITFVRKNKEELTFGITALLGILQQLHAGGGQDGGQGGGQQ